MGTYTPIFQLTQRLGREGEPVNGGPFHSTNRPRNLLHPHVPRRSRARRCQEAAPPTHIHAPTIPLTPGMSPRDHTTESRLSHRGQRSLSTPVLDLRSPRDRSQTPTATDMAVHWWRLAGNSTDPADLALVAPRERARPNRPNTPRTQPNSAAAERGCGTSGRGPGAAPDATAPERTPRRGPVAVPVGPPSTSATWAFTM